MKIVSIFSVQTDNGFVLKNFGDFMVALNYCLKFFTPDKIEFEQYDEKKSINNFNCYEKY